MTVHFHASSGNSGIADLEISHEVYDRRCVPGSYVSIALVLGSDRLTIHADALEAEQIAVACRVAADALAKVLEGKAVDA